jgi:hypothetical protein
VSLLKPIDSRSSAEIAEQTHQLIRREFPNWNGGEAGNALTQIFAHLCSVVIDKLNQAPEKNFLAFLDLLGNTLTPAVPARVPLSFTLSSSAVESALLPSGTRLFAPPPAGSSEPVYFETEEELWLTTLELKCLLSWSDTRKYATLTPLINSANSAGEALFQQENQIYYFGFALAEPRKLPVGLAVVVYFDVENPPYHPALTAGTTDSKLLKWEYASGLDINGVVWRPLYVDDQTQQLTTAGKIVFEVPGDFSIQEINKEIYYWIRVSTIDGAVIATPSHLKWLAINTVAAIQAATVNDEILGSSTGNPGQTFTTFRRPVLPGQNLEIREKIAANGNLPAQDDWQLWQEVPDFYASTAVDRHYLLDHDSGKLTFGNGQNGMIPPFGVRNIRMKSYRCGGGIQGNVPAGTVTNFWIPLSWVDKVTNHTAATGGSDTETYESFLERAPKALRHRDRAVTETDYEDLARMATAEVAIARCVPLVDLAADPYQHVDEKTGIGKVSLIVVPKTTDARPTPTQTLIKQIKDYIVPRAPSIVSLSVVGPLYLQVNTAVTVRLTSILLKDSVEKTIKARLAEFLHPLTGRDGRGWAFGREPHESDFYSLLSTVNGIDYIEKVSIQFGNNQGEAAIKSTGRFLVYSGVHTITMNP